MNFPKAVKETTAYGSAAIVGLIVLAVIATILSAASGWLQSVDVSTLPVVLAPMVEMLQSAFVIPALAFVVVFIKSVYGLLKAKLQSDLATSPVITENLKSIVKNLAFYLPVATILFATAPQPYATIALGIITTIDLVRSELTSLVGEIVAVAKKVL